MQLKITFCADAPLVLPLSHHHVLQGFLYHILEGNPEFSAFLHDTGYQYDAHNYKLFCFGLLQGSYRVQVPNIIFEGDVVLEVRSPFPDFIALLAKQITQQKEFALHGQAIKIVELMQEETSISKSNILVKMQAPLCLSKTIYNGEKKFTQYATPLDSDFSAQMNQNFVRKYRAAYHCEPPCDIKIEAERVSSKDKYVTKFKNQIYITAWRGVYRLQGSPAALTFLYDTGLGARNAQGFGMFDLF